MMKNYLIVGFLLLTAVYCEAQKNKYFVKEVIFPQGATPEQKVEMASRLVPTDDQYAWQQLELTAFIHFGMNTFTNREWGDGKENPNMFYPSELNAEQWVKALKDGGFKMVILTAKHHDGFCLWPTKTTRHSVASSRWKEGKGDVVKELKEACDKYDMKFGVYLSPWDRNAECYGDSPRYNRMFAEQLKELLSNYGTIHEIWFDGANAEGPNGRKQVYDWKLFYAVMDSLQPHAVRAIMGDDVRWVGNERGLGRTTEWSATVLMPGIYSEAKATNRHLGISATSKDLGGRELIAKADRMFWYPSEVDVSIRPGWFYHRNQDKQVRSLTNLVDIYFQSVGYNSVLLLNIPPDQRGLLNEHDVIRLKEFGDYLKTTFADNKLLKGDKVRDLKPAGSCEYKVRKGESVNVVMIGEDIRRGQRVEGFTIEACIDGNWKEVGKGTTIGYKRLLRFPVCSPEKIRLTVTDSRGVAHIREVGAFYAADTKTHIQNATWSEVPVKDWKVISVDSEVPGGEAQLAIDGKPATYWKSGIQAGKHSLIVDMGKTYRLTGFTYVPVTGENIDGTIYLYRFSVSEDGKKWTECECPGEFSNIMHNPVPQAVRFRKTYPARYFRLESLQEINNKPFVTVGEMGVQVK